MQAVSKESINCGAKKQRLKNTSPLGLSVVLNHTDDETEGDGLQGLLPSNRQIIFSTFHEKALSPKSGVLRSFS